MPTEPTRKGHRFVVPWDEQQGFNPVRDGDASCNNCGLPYSEHSEAALETAQRERDAAQSRFEVMAENATNFGVERDSLRDEVAALRRSLDEIERLLRNESVKAAASIATHRGANAAYEAFLLALQIIREERARVEQGPCSACGDGDTAQEFHKHGMSMTGGAVERLKCPTCGCVMHGKYHYGSMETCRRIARLEADFAAFRATAAELDADRIRKIEEVAALRRSLDEAIRQFDALIHTLRPYKSSWVQKVCSNAGLAFERVREERARDSSGGS